MSELGLCSRREADEWIENGWVKVNGQVVTTLGVRVPVEPSPSPLFRLRAPAGLVRTVVNTPDFDLRQVGTDQLLAAAAEAARPARVPQLRPRRALRKRPRRKTNIFHFSRAVPDVRR